MLETTVKRVRKVHTLVKQGLSVADACKEVGVAGSAYYTWRKQGMPLKGRPMQRRTKAQLEADRAAKSPIKAASQAAEKVINKHHQDPAVILDVIKEVLQMQKEYLDNNDVDAFRTCQTLLSWLSDYYEQLR